MTTAYEVEYYDQVRAETEDYQRRLAVRAADLGGYVPCDDPELPSDYTFGLPEEVDA